MTPVDAIDLRSPEVDSRRVAHPGRTRLSHRFPVTAYIVRRVGLGLLTALIASLLIYVAITILPGNVAEIVLGKTATPGRVAAIEHQLNQGQPIWDRYIHFLGHFVTGKFGYSTAGLVQGENITVTSIIGPALRNSAILAAITMIFFLPLTIALGLFAGLKAGSARDTAISVSSLAIGALPEFLVGTILIVVFFDWANVLPPVSTVAPGQTPLSDPTILVLPVATLLLVSLAFGSRVLRASVAEIVSRDYVTYARIRGFSRWRVIWRYVLPNALPPAVQIVAQQLQYLIGGLVIVESVFGYPGIGTALVNAITVHDVEVVVVLSTILACVYIMINVVADVIALLLDPRVRTSLG